MAQSSYGQDDDLISGINVTPLVDITLVILIIFIMTASVIFKDAVPVELPTAASAEKTPAGLITVGISAGGEIRVNGKLTPLAALDRAVGAASEAARASGQAASAIISADVRARYGLFARVVDRLRVLGIRDIALDTRPEELASR